MAFDLIPIWAVYVVAQIADVVTTIKVLDNGGREINPIMVWIMRWAGGQWWVVKLSITFAAAITMQIQGYPYGVLAIGVITGLVALNNWRQI